MSITISFSLEDLPTLYHTALPVKHFRDASEAGRFNYIERTKAGANTGLPDMEMSWPTFDTGSILWLDSTASALLAKKVLQEAGFIAKVMVDTDAEDAHEAYAVLTSWDHTVFEPPLTDAPVIIEFMLTSDDEDESSLIKATEEFISSKADVKLMGTLNLESHGEHFHMLGMLKIPGNQIEDFTVDLAEALEILVQVNIVSHDA